MYMQNKKIMFCVLFLLCFSAIAIGESFKVEPSKLNGTWMPTSSYQWRISHPEDRSKYFFHDFSWGKGKSLQHTSMEIDINAMTYYDPGMFIYSIKEYQQIDNTTYKVLIYRQVFDDIPESLYELEIILHFLNEDSFWLESEYFEKTGTLFGKKAPWYRLSGQNVMSQPANINDNRVRIRVQPNLQSDTWGFLNKGEKVTVIDKSKEKQKIGDMENFWYKVDAQGYPDGWVYGEYITFE